MLAYNNVILPELLAFIRALGQSPTEFPSTRVLANFGTKGSSNDLVSETDPDDLGRLLAPWHILHVIDQLVDPGEIVVSIGRYNPYS